MIKNQYTKKKHHPLTNLVLYLKYKVIGRPYNFTYCVIIALELAENSFMELSAEITFPASNLKLAM